MDQNCTIVTPRFKPPLCTNRPQTVANDAPKDNSTQKAYASLRPVSSIERPRPAKAYNPYKNAHVPIIGGGALSPSETWRPSRRMFPHGIYSSRDRVQIPYMEKVEPTTKKQPKETKNYILPAAAILDNTPETKKVRKSGIRTFTPKKVEPPPKSPKPRKPPVFTCQNKPHPLPGGGIFPENAKLGKRVKTEIRPKDNADVIKYMYSGGICPNPNEFPKNNEREIYLNMLKEHSRAELEQNAKMYNYFKERRSKTTF